MAAKLPKRRGTATTTQPKVETTGFSTMSAAKTPCCGGATWFVAYLYATTVYKRKCRKCGARYTVTVHPTFGATTAGREAHAEILVQRIEWVRMPARNSK